MKVLIDSDFLVGIFREGDPHHTIATKLLKVHKDRSSTLLVLNLVLQEAATVLSHRTGMEAVRLFYKKIPELELVITHIDEDVEQHAWEIFLKQTKKGTSFVDCANLAALEYYHIERIASFDRFYPRELLISSR